MILLDSNVLIDATRPEMEASLAWIDEESVAVSAITVVEVLGYHKLPGDERVALESYLDHCEVYPIDEPIIREAVRLRQARKMSLGDAIIASTALVRAIPLATRDVTDFTWIKDLHLIDPLGRAAWAEEGILRSARGEPSSAAAVAPEGCEP